MKRLCRICRERWTQGRLGWCMRCLRILLSHKREAGLRKMPLDQLKLLLYGGDIYKV